MTPKNQKPPRCENTPEAQQSKGLNTTNSTNVTSTDKTSTDKTSTDRTSTNVTETNVTETNVTLTNVTLTNGTIMTQTTDTSYIDLAQIEEFTNLLGHKPTLVAIHEDTTTAEKPKHSPIFIRGFARMHKARLNRLQEDGYGIFYMLNIGTDTKDDGITEIKALCTDYDGGDTKPSYATEPSFIVHTSEGRHQAFWLVNDCSVDDFKEYQKELAASYGTDPSITNPSRLMRLPGTMNMKQKGGVEPYRVHTQQGSLKVYGVSEVIKSPSRNVSPSKAPTYVSANSDEAIPAKVLDAVQPIRNADEGTINATVFAVSCELGKMLDVEREVKLRHIQSALSFRGRTNDPHHLATAERGLNTGELQAVRKADGNTNRCIKGMLLRACKGNLYREAYGLSIVYKGEVVPSIVSLYLKLEEEIDIKLPKEYTLDILNDLLSKSEYQRNSLQEEFQKHAETYSADEGLAALYEAHEHLGLDNPLDATKVESFFIGLTARTLFPACKVDTVLMLIGKQGLFKSTFFETLLGLNYYVTIDPHDSDKDTVLKMSKAAIVCIDEAGNMLSRKDKDKLKGFITSRVDTIRRPYGSSTEDFERHSVLVATSNETSIMNDPSGSRRFFIVEPKFIDLPWFKENAPRIFAGCVHLLNEKVVQAGLDPHSLPGELALWWLTEEEQKESSERNRDFEVSGSLDESVLNALELMPIEFSHDALLAQLTTDGVEIKKQDVKTCGTVKAILQRNGCVHKRMRVTGKRNAVYRWFKPADEEPTVSEEMDVKPEPFEVGEYVFVDDLTSYHIVMANRLTNIDGEDIVHVCPIDKEGQPKKDGTYSATFPQLTKTKWKQGGSVNQLR